MALRNRELHARNDDDGGWSVTLCQCITPGLPEYSGFPFFIFWDTRQCSSLYSVVIHVVYLPQPLITLHPHSVSLSINLLQTKNSACNGYQVSESLPATRLKLLPEYKLLREQGNLTL